MRVQLQRSGADQVPRAEALRRGCACGVAAQAVHRAEGPRSDHRGSHQQNEVVVMMMMVVFC